MPSWLIEMVNLVEQFPNMRFWALFASTTIEYVFPIFPGDTMVIAAGFFHAQGAFSLLEIFLAIAGGTIIGSMLTYFLGRVLAENKFKFAWTDRLIASSHYQVFSTWYKKWGYWLILINRFFPGIRSIFFIAAGISHLAIIPTLIAGLISGLIYNASLYFLGILVGNNINGIFSILQQYTILAYSVLGSIAMFVIYIIIRKRNINESNHE